jgi:hypothetical protein
LGSNRQRVLILIFTKKRVLILITKETCWSRWLRGAAAPPRHPYALIRPPGSAVEIDGRRRATNGDMSNNRMMHFVSSKPAPLIARGEDRASPLRLRRCRRCRLSVKGGKEEHTGRGSAMRRSWGRQIWGATSLLLSALL